MTHCMLYGASEGSAAPGDVALGVGDGVGDKSRLFILVKVGLFQILRETDRRLDDL